MNIINWNDSSAKNKKYSFVNLYSYILLRNREEFDSIDFMSDGFLMCVLAKFFRKELHRYSFDLTSLAPIVFAKYRDSKFALIGSSDSNIKYFTNFVRDEYGVDVVYSESGYFFERSMRTVCQSIIDSSADIVIVGLGTPLQEEFIVCLYSMGFSGVSFTCGGFITQTASSGGEYYPQIINRLNVRFLYRMIKEPHTIKRYVFSYPKGVFLFIYDCIFRRNTFN